ncbi:MAG: hypothetical protein EP332_07715 [Bacteroidetes bacterium]|nr:MAG: hypothetical protein EP332_07715 [Bacteroidota bacterium]
MKILKSTLLLFLAGGVISGCSKLKESPDPVTDTGTTTGGSTGGGNTGDPAVYVGLWKMTDKKLGGNSVFAGLDTIPEISLQTAGIATWNYYVGGNLARTASDAYTINLSSNPVTIDFITFGTVQIVNKTGSVMEWSRNDPAFAGLEVIETYTKQ